MSRAADAEILRAAASEAAAAAMRWFRADPRVWDKGGSPVSEADFAADKILRERLRGARPEYGWMSEESDDAARLAARRLWIVDPIDGTRSFIEGSADFAVSAALIEDGRPVLGVLAAPARHEVYVAEQGGGAWLNGVRVAPRTHDPGFEEARFTGARTVVSPARWRLGQAPAQKAIYLGSLALRVASVGLGRFDAAFAFGHPHEWDIAAAHLFAQEAGARVTDRAGAAILYNASMSAAIHGVLTAPPRLHGEILERLA